jgi:Zn-dependent protease with chaperone function
MTLLSLALWAVAAGAFEPLASPGTPPPREAEATVRRIFRMLVETAGVSSPPRLLYSPLALGVYDCDSRSVMAVPGGGGGDAGAVSCPNPGAHAAVFVTQRVWDGANTCAEESLETFGEAVPPDDALTLVLAHELSHITMRHDPLKRQWLRDNCLNPPPTWPAGRTWDGNWIAYLAGTGASGRRMAEAVAAEIQATPEARRQAAIETANYGVCSQFMPGFRQLTLQHEREAIQSAHQMLVQLRANRVAPIARCAGMCAEHALVEIEHQRGLSGTPASLRTHPTPEERVEIARAWARDCPASTQSVSR